MDIIVVDILLALIRCVDVGFRILNEVAPFDAANVREFAPPDGGAGITNTSVPRFSVEHSRPFLSVLQMHSAGVNLKSGRLRIAGHNISAFS